MEQHRALCYRVADSLIVVLTLVQAPGDGCWRQGRQGWSWDQQQAAQIQVGSMSNAFPGSQQETPE